VGVESTIVDLTSEAPRLLRPGGISAEALESLLGMKLGRSAPPGVRAPGMLASHYAPRARVELVSPRELAARALQLGLAGERVVVLVGGADARVDLNGLANVTRF